MEIYVECPGEICARRDQKGIYEKAKAGIIKEVTSISAPYESPSRPDLKIQSHKEEPAAAAERVIALIKNRGII